jgi:hypothetical protein
VFTGCRPSRSDRITTEAAWPTRVPISFLTHNCKVFHYNHCIHFFHLGAQVIKVGWVDIWAFSGSWRSDLTGIVGVRFSHIPSGRF